MKNSVITAVFAASLLAATPTFAGSVSGKIVFDKRPPLGGVVYVKGQAAKKIDAAIDQKNKAFTKKVIAGTPGAKAIFNNNDSQDHNIFANDIHYGVNFDVGLIPAGGQSDIAMDWKKDSIVRIGCKIHPKMKAYVANVDSNNFQVLEFSKDTLEYTFELQGVNKPEEKIILKLPKYDDIELALQTGTTQTVDLMRKGKRKGSLTLTRK